MMLLVLLVLLVLLPTASDYNGLYWSNGLQRTFFKSASTTKKNERVFEKYERDFGKNERDFVLQSSSGG
jgi:hypothetical protein